jgi:hypothetical protein
LETINCGTKINAKKFGEYALKTAELLTALYPWKPMKATVHRILYHGERIIENNLLPIGELSEEAQEKRNKDYRYFREHNTRKMTREKSNEDLIHILLVSSDPYLSAIRFKWNSKKNELDIETQQLLEENQDSLEDSFTLIP